MKRTPDYSKVIFRLPADLKRWLKKYAAANDRTMNGELIAMIKAAKAASVVKLGEALR